MGTRLPWLQALEAGRKGEGLRLWRLRELLGDSDSEQRSPNASWQTLAEWEFIATLGRELDSSRAEALLRYICVVYRRLPQRDQLVAGHTLALGPESDYDEYLFKRREHVRGLLPKQPKDMSYRRNVEYPALGRFAALLEKPQPTDIEALGLDPTRFKAYLTPDTEARRTGLTLPRSRRVLVIRGSNDEASSQLITFLQSVGLQSVTWEEPDGQTDAGNPSFEDFFRQNIASCQCVVASMTGAEVAHPAWGEPLSRLQPQPSVVFQLGWALSKVSGKRVIPVFLAMQGEEFLPHLPVADDFGYVQLTNDAATRNKLTVRLEEAGCDLSEKEGWLDKATGGDFDFVRQEETSCGSQSPGNNGLGKYTEFIVDAYLAPRLNQKALLEEAKREIRLHQPLSLKYHYLGNWMSEYWLDVCRDDLYGHLRLRETTSSHVDEMLGETDLVGRKLSIMSLGPGDGRSDVDLISCLQPRVDLDFYYMVDISIDLLQVAVKQVIEYQKKHRAKRDFRIKAIYADFEQNLEELEPFLPPRHPILYTMTGYTLGNIEAEEFLKRLYPLMTGEDLLLVDSRIHEGGPIPDRNSADLKAAVERPYSSMAVNAFAFGPVEIASRCRCDPELVTFDRDIEVGGALSSAVTVFITCPGVEKNEVFRRHFLDDKNDQALARWGALPYRLAWVTYYDFDQLKHWFARMGYAIPWSYKENDMGIFLLRKA